MRIHPTKPLVPFLLLAALGLGAAKLGRTSPAGDIAAAAGAFLDSLSPELRAAAARSFDDPARLDWHFVPRGRPGVTFAQMDAGQRTAARNLLRAALSSRGVLKAEGIMALDGVLREMERAAGGDGASRDPLAYTIAVYGMPGKGTPWGWKIEGHHLSLNFTLPAGEAVAHTPAFMGTNPATVAQGPQAGLRVLSREEDLGRALAGSLTEAQRVEGILSGQVPSDILTMPGRGLDAAPARGVRHSDLDASQQALLLELIEEFAGNLRRELALAELERIRAAGLAEVRFAWAGELLPGRPHYYRISGPTFVIEYDNTANNANHVHTVWHDRERNFGQDLLRQHYEHGHPHR